MANPVRVAAGGAAVVMVVQGIYTLVDRPNEVYAGSTADAVADTLQSVGMLLIAVALVVASRRYSGPRAGGIAGIAAGFLLLTMATVATVAAGEERLDPVFVVGFALVALCGLGVVATMLRSAPASAGAVGALVLGLVLGLAFHAVGGGLGLAAAAACLASSPLSEDADDDAQPARRQPLHD